MQDILEQKKNISYEEYIRLKKELKTLKEEIEKCPLIYEVWMNSCDSSMTMYREPDKKISTHLSKERAYEKRDMLNKEYTGFKPYYIRTVELDD